MRQLIDWNYLNPKQDTTKMKPNFEVHMVPEFLRLKEPTIEIQAELKVLRVTLYSGKDFDFAP